MAPLRLKRVYSAAGLRPQGLEPSDFLPVMPEFAELAEGGLGAHILAEHRTAVEVRRAQLQEKWSPYLHLIDAVRFDLPHLHKADLETVKRLGQGGPPSRGCGLQPLRRPRSCGRTVRRRRNVRRASASTSSVQSGGCRLGC